MNKIEHIVRLEDFDNSQVFIKNHEDTKKCIIDFNNDFSDYSEFIVIFSNIPYDHKIITLPESIGKIIIEYVIMNYTLKMTNYYENTLLCDPNTTYCIGSIEYFLRYDNKCVFVRTNIQNDKYEKMVDLIKEIIIS